MKKIQKLAKKFEAKLAGVESVDTSVKLNQDELKFLLRMAGSAEAPSGLKEKIHQALMNTFLFKDDPHEFSMESVMSGENEDDFDNSFKMRSIM